MRQSKQSPAASPATDAPTQKQIGALTAAVEQLTQQVELLTDVLDQVREDLNWTINNRDEFRCEPRHDVMHITSMPKDPCAPDFGERLNRFSAKDLCPEEEPDPSPTPLPTAGTSRQGNLFD